MTLINPIPMQNLSYDCQNAFTIEDIRTTPANETIFGDPPPDCYTMRANVCLEVSPYFYALEKYSNMFDETLKTGTLKFNPYQFENLLGKEFLNSLFLETYRTADGTFSDERAISKKIYSITQDSNSNFENSFHSFDEFSKSKCDSNMSWASWKQSETLISNGNGDYSCNFGEKNRVAVEVVKEEKFSFDTFPKPSLTPSEDVFHNSEERQIEYPIVWNTLKPILSITEEEAKVSEKMKNAFERVISSKISSTLQYSYRSKKFDVSSWKWIQEYPIMEKRLMFEKKYLAFERTTSKLFPSKTQNDRNPLKNPQSPTMFKRIPKSLLNENKPKSLTKHLEDFLCRENNFTKQIVSDDENYATCLKNLSHLLWDVKQSHLNLQKLETSPFKWVRQLPKTENKLKVLENRKFTFDEALSKQILSITLDRSHSDLKILEEEVDCYQFRDSDLHLRAKTSKHVLVNSTYSGRFSENRRLDASNGLFSANKKLNVNSDMRFDSNFERKIQEGHRQKSDFLNNTSFSDNETEIFKEFLSGLKSTNPSYVDECAKTCHLCKKGILNKFLSSRFGLLLNCWHSFCYSCIRDHSKSQRLNIGSVKCPKCGKQSPGIVSSPRWIRNTWEKEALFKEYAKETKFFNRQQQVFFNNIFSNLN